MIKFNRYQIHLLRTAIEYFIDAKKDEIEYDWDKEIHHDAIESRKAWIKDAEDLDRMLYKMRDSNE